MKYLVLGLVTALSFSSVAEAQNVRFGDNRSEYARDGECDDRRFTGPAMASALDNENIGHDAADCRSAFRDGRVKLWDRDQARAATQCSKIRFGNNTSEWARDGECDDYRFEGKGMHSIVLTEDIGRDAYDCRRLCNAGMIFLRDY